MLRGRINLRPSEPELGNSSEGKRLSSPPICVSIKGGVFMSLLKSFISNSNARSWTFIIGIAAASFLISRILKKKNTAVNTKKLTYGSLCIAMSFILSYIKLYHLPQGGSITPGSFLPLMFFAFMFGPVDGILAGMVYGILQLIQDPYVVHWFQLLLDYPLAYGALGLAGYTKKHFGIGILLSGIGVAFFHFLAGVFFFSSYTPAGLNPVIYSLVYNISYVGPDIIICFVISLIPQFKNALNKIKSAAI